MRRSRFAKAIEPGGGREKASIREALWFDLSAPESPDEHSLALWRVAALDHAAVLLLATHLLMAAACVFAQPTMALVPSLANPVVPAMFVLLLDLVAAFALHWRDRFDFAPH